MLLTILAHSVTGNSHRKREFAATVTYGLGRIHRKRHSYAVVVDGLVFDVVEFAVGKNVLAVACRHRVHSVFDRLVEVFEVNFEGNVSVDEVIAYKFGFHVAVPYIVVGFNFRGEVYAGLEDVAAETVYRTRAFCVYSTGEKFYGDGDFLIVVSAA